jgi:hypothetical protein
MLQRRGGFERVNQTSRDTGYVVHYRQKQGSVCLRGLVKSMIFLRNCGEAARTSSAVTGGSKLKRGLMFLHIASYSFRC